MIVTLRQKEGMQHPGNVIHFYDGHIVVKNDGIAGVVEVDDTKKPHWIPLLMDHGFRIVEHVEKSKKVVKKNDDTQE